MCFSIGKSERVPLTAVTHSTEPQTSLTWTTQNFVKNLDLTGRPPMSTKEGGGFKCNCVKVHQALLWMGKPCNCFHLQRMWGLKKSYHGTDTKKRTGSFNTITFMTAHGNSLNHSFSESNIGHWSCNTKLRFGGINVKTFPPFVGNYRFDTSWN